jgi:hypothetical protein
LSKDKAVDTITQVLHNFDTTSIVLDGIDECVDEKGDEWTSGECPEIFLLVHNVIERLAGKARLITSSRGNLQKYYHDVYPNISIKASDEDVRNYVRNALKSSKYAHDLQEEPGEEEALVNAIAEKANGQ